MEQLIITGLTLFCFPLFLVALLAITLATFGKSLGLREKYVQLLLRVFEYGQRKIDKYEKKHQNERIIDHGEDDSEDELKLSQEGYKQIIRRDLSLSVNKGLELPSKRPEFDTKDLKKEFHISDIMYFAKGGVEAIIEDEVTSCFTAEELKTWNFLTRTRSQGYQFISLRVTIIWVFGCFFRYFVLLPFRCLLLSLGLFWLIASTAIIGYLPNSGFKRKLNEYVSLMSHRILARACSGVMRFHNRENMVKNGICVANHTSPIDVILLSCDNCYAMVGQNQGGLIGVIQRALSRATSHIWFERSEAKDRELVMKRLQEHVADKDKLPILIFPEGTCINNTSVMMFKKGSFEVCPTIYPVAIKYDPRFGDAFWNSSKMGMVSHIFEILTSWALVVDVWYLPPMTRMDGEDAVMFANRVKKEIARQGGLVELDWDGQLKRMKVKDSWKQKPQEDFSKLLKVD